jgi:hypothetical protein
MRHFHIKKAFINQDNKRKLSIDLCSLKIENLMHTFVEYSFYVIAFFMDPFIIYLR